MIKTTSLASILVCVSVSPVLGQHLEMFAAGFDRPLEMVADPTDDGRFYILEQGGAIRVLENGRLLSEPMLDLSGENFTDKFNEQGLLGMCLDPGWATNRRFYINYTGDDGTTHISRFTADSPTACARSSEEVLLTVEQPYWNHDAGPVRFGPDGFLYVSLGDGGAANDPHGNGQNLETLLGSMLRLDVTGEPDEGLAYAIPASNPFVGRDDARAEIWAYGLRNVWKFEFDSLGRMWMGDVGQNRFEEIILQPAGSTGGENYGWNEMEGMGPFRSGSKPSADPRKLRASKHRDRGFEPPLWVYRQDQVGSVTGGYFYEGEAVASLNNRYIFADYALQRIWTLKVRDGRADDVVEWTDRLTVPDGGDEDSPFFISAFGRDNAGELYIVSHRAGEIYKIVP